MTDNSAMRRQPKQARSQQRVTHLLDTAERVFAEVGYQAATTNAIAERAGVSIGSLYQFFPNKDALAEALIERYLTEMRGLYDWVLSPEVAGLSTTVLIHQFVDRLAEFEASHVGFHAVLASPPTEAASVKGSIHEEIVQRIDDLFASRFPDLNPERRHLGAIVSTAIVKGMMPLTEEQGVLPPEMVLTELKTALLAYLRALLVREGHPLPDDLK